MADWTDGWTYHDPILEGEETINEEQMDDMKQCAHKENTGAQYRRLEARKQAVKRAKKIQEIEQQLEVIANAVKETKRQLNSVTQALYDTMCLLDELR